MEPIFQIGKGGVGDELLKQLAIALEARELIKVHILETALLETKSAANEIAAALGAEPVQAIGSKFVLYKQAKNVKNRKIELPRK
jgi:RNA-binding protein